ncbi:MAG: protein-glutamine glutaminase family protein [Oligoflexia bacterium]|nr:protein-glutamine glutaminase family protein [Oligoflexia bacterium]
MVLFLLLLSLSPQALANLNDCKIMYSQIIEELDPNLSKEMNEKWFQFLSYDFLNTHLYMKAGNGDIKGWNRAVFSHLDRIPFRDRGLKKRKPGFTVKEQNELFQRTDQNPVSSICHVSKYDPQGNIGFCFGRATTVHIEALRMGIQKEMIKKIWAVGHMKNDIGDWQYHVATIVRDKVGNWVVIDPIFTNPKSVKEWASELEKMSADNQLQFFISEPGRFAPNHPGNYGKQEFSHPAYNNFFLDLMKQSQKDSKSYRH